MTNEGSLVIFFMAQDNSEIIDPVGHGDVAADHGIAMPAKIDTQQVPVLAKNGMVNKL